MSSQDEAAATTTVGAANGSPAGHVPTPKEAAFMLAILNNMKNKPEVSLPRFFLFRKQILAFIFTQAESTSPFHFPSNSTSLSNERSR